MHSAQPKVLHRLAGRPIVAHVLAAARSLAPRAIAVVVGHGAEAVRDALAAPDLAFVLQDPPRGTGDATRIALAALPDDGVTLVTIGDIPLVQPQSLAALAERAQAGRAGGADRARSRSPPGLAASCATPPGACAPSSRTATCNRGSRRSTRSTPA